MTKRLRMTVEGITDNPFLEGEVVRVERVEILDEADAIYRYTFVRPKSLNFMMASWPTPRRAPK